ncbi:MAG: hypothetical protein J0I47_01370 [Sphingomonas sp.]|nr:hypothetical protein [Sphingomonas sp.]
MPFLLALAQTTPVAPLPRATPLPPPTSEEGQVMAPVTAILKALETNNGGAVLAATRPEGVVAVALEAPDGRRGVRHLSWSDFASRLKPDGNRYEERLFDPAIEIDGDVAFVWARYTVMKNGAPEHCGYDLFDLVREGGAWKVLNVTWSQRTTGCQG